MHGRDTRHSAEASAGPPLIHDASIIPWLTTLCTPPSKRLYELTGATSAMGKSRSATCVIAFLMQKYNISPAEALEQIRQSRPLCEPNEGFMKQLELYHAMQMPEDLDSNAVYQRWVYQREIEMSRACGLAPEAEKIRFEDEHVSKAEEGGFSLKCKKCRYVFVSCSIIAQVFDRIVQGCPRHFAIYIASQS